MNILPKKVENEIQFLATPMWWVGSNSYLLNLRECKTADKDAYWFLLAVSLFSPISNENLPRLKLLNIERSEFFKALNKANSSC